MECLTKQEANLASQAVRPGYWPLSVKINSAQKTVQHFVLVDKTQNGIVD